MHPVLFVPKEFEAGSAEATLEAVGLPDFILGAIADRPATGPDDAIGTVFRWTRDKAEPARWRPAVRSGRLAAGRYHVGFAAAAPHLSELERPYLYQGRTVALGPEMHATIAGPLDLSFELRAADDGSWKYELQRRFHRYGIECLKWRQRVADGSVLDASGEELAQFAVSALRLNYRITPEVVDGLSLLDSETIKDIFFAAVGTGSGS